MHFIIMYAGMDDQWEINGQVEYGNTCREMFELCMIFMQQQAWIFVIPKPIKYSVQLTKGT